MGRLPNHLNWVAGEHPICSHYWQFLFQALRDQHPVEWVAVVIGQRFDPQDVICRHRQDPNSIKCQF